MEIMNMHATHTRWHVDFFSLARLSIQRDSGKFNMFGWFYTHQLHKDPIFSKDKLIVGPKSLEQLT